MNETVPFLKIPTIKIDIRKKVDRNGIIYLHSGIPLNPYPMRVTERLLYWAGRSPNTVFLGQRGENGQWDTLTYGATWEKIQSIGQYLLNSGASTERPVVIVSENSLEHGLLALAAMHVGIPYAPLTPAYASRSSDFKKLRTCIDQLSPGLVFMQDGTAVKKAIQTLIVDIPVVAVENVGSDQVDFYQLLNTEVTAEVQKAFQAIKPSATAKILFTSGSTGTPVGVINTHDNLCSNWQQITQTFPFIEDGGLTLIDWLPWSHTFGGNQNFGITMYNGGSLYIDGGKPTPQGFSLTLQNLNEIAPTAYFNVPKGFEMLLTHLKEDGELCALFFSNLKMLFYAAASLPQHIWDGLDGLAMKTIGKKLLISSGYGMTESSPAALLNTNIGAVSGNLGIPVPGLQIKLVPDGDKLEARFRGKNMTPGYWRNKEATINAFDDEGFFKTGDALKLVDTHNPNEGLVFDGRLAEDFKLSTGTWVNVGTLRARLIEAGNGLINDVVITGHDRAFLGAIIFPNLKHCAKLAGLHENTPIRELLKSSLVCHKLQEVLDHLAQQGTGSSTQIKRAVCADFELSLENGEITPKGSVNQRAVLANRSGWVEKLYQAEILREVFEIQHNIS